MGGFPRQFRPLTLPRIAVRPKCGVKDGDERRGEKRCREWSCSRTLSLSPAIISLTHARALALAVPFSRKVACSWTDEHAPEYVRSFRFSHLFFSIISNCRGFPLSQPFHFAPADKTRWFSGMVWCGMAWYGMWRCKAKGAT